MVGEFGDGKSGWRFSEYGRIGSDNKDVDAFIAKEKINGQTKEKRGDILNWNASDLVNFVGINFESLSGYSEIVSKYAEQFENR